MKHIIILLMSGFFLISTLAVADEENFKPSPTCKSNCQQGLMDSAV